MPTVDDDSTAMPNEKQDETYATETVVHDEAKTKENDKKEELKEEKLTTVEEHETEGDAKAEVLMSVDEESEPVTDSEHAAAKALQSESDCTADPSQGFLSHFYVAFQ